MTGFVLSQRSTGLGDCLVSLVSAWRFARATGRTLVIDWCHSCYAETAEENAFGLFFEPIAQLGGVPVRLAPTSIPGPPWPPLAIPPPPNDEQDLDNWHAEVHEQLEQDRLRSVALIKSGQDVPWPTVRLGGCLPVQPEPELCRLALEDLRPHRAILDEVARFTSDHLAGGPVVGVHVRHGNGGNIMAHAKYWDQGHDPIGLCIAAIESAKQRLGSDTTVLLCTDSSEIQRLLAERVEGLVTRQKLMLPEGAGQLHLDARGTARDALVEMLLLRQSTTLIRYPPDSYFSWWASLYADEVISPLVL